jgi:Peptidase family S41
MARRRKRRSGRDRGERPRRSGQAKHRRGATARNARPRRLIPAAVLQKTHKAVRPLFRAGIGLDEFFSKAKHLTAQQRARIVDQATMLLEGFYAHLPLKRAMYAVDPLQGLRRLRQRLPLMKSDRPFHAEMISIFASVCDLHTNYVLPRPYKDAQAWLPFKIESYFDRGRRRYIVSHIAPGFAKSSFCKGVEVLYWNGIPIARAVEVAGAQSGGNSPAARHAHGLLNLTARPLLMLAPPDEEWVVVRYRTRGGREQEIQFDWVVTKFPLAAAVVKRRARSNQTEYLRQIFKFLFAPDVVDSEKKIAAASDSRSRVKGTESLMPDVFRSRVARTRHGKFGYIRIFSFNVDDPEALVLEFIRLVTQCLPQNGLIIDVRDNGGGSSLAAESLLQLIAPHRPIVPQRLYFINTPHTLRLCQLQRTNLREGPRGLSPWIESIQRSMETGAMYSASFPSHDQEALNAIGRLYPGRTIVITNAVSYSATEFFAAGFQDHGGKILGVDNVTGGGGANVRTHTELRNYYKSASNSPFRGLPKGAELRIAFRRSQRVGPQIGNDVEDFGITPNYFYEMTRDDLLKGNVGLINYAASLLV